MRVLGPCSMGRLRSCRAPLVSCEVASQLRPAKAPRTVFRRDRCASLGRRVHLPSCWLLLAQRMYDLASCSSVLVAFVLDDGKQLRAFTCDGIKELRSKYRSYNEEASRIRFGQISPSPKMHRLGFQWRIKRRAAAGVSTGAIV